MNYKVLTTEKSAEWKNYLELLPIEQQDIYYTPEYYSLYENYGDGKALCFVYEKDGKLALYPFLINSVNELGYELDKEYYDIQGAYGYNGVVSNSYDTSFIEAFYKAFGSYCIDKNIIAEFTRFHPLINNYGFSQHNMKVVFDRKTVMLNLGKHSSINEIWVNEYNKRARNNCKRAIKQGVSFSTAKKPEDYEKFYEIYLQTLDFVGASKYYYFNKRFIKDVCCNIKPHTTLILAWLNNILVGGIIFFCYGKYANNYLSASSVNYRNLNTKEYLQDIAIKMAFDNNCSFMHLGGGNSNKPDDSLFAFKSKFSKETGEFYIGKKVHNPGVYDKIVDQWINKNPDKEMKHKNFLLKYRV